MAQFPSKFPYRRREWEILVFPAMRRHPLDGCKELRRWVPDTHVKLTEAIDMFGGKFVADWNGTELNARRLPDDPDPPWEWSSDRTEKEGIFIISDKPEMVFVSHEEAKVWWKAIEPIMRYERDENLAAFQRMEDCREQLRNALASEQFGAEILDEFGTFRRISAQSWISNKGSVFLSSGVGEVELMGGMQLTMFTGPIVFPNDFLKVGPKETATKRSDTPASLDEKQFPYLAFMLNATNSGLFNQSKRTPKKTIEAWLHRNWPSDLREPTDTKVRNMASFLRRPEDEKGGLH